MGPPTSRVGSGTSCQPMGKAPPTGPSSSWDKVGSGTDDCPQLGPHLLWLSPHLSFPGGRKELPGEFGGGGGTKSTPTPTSPPAWLSRPSSAPSLPLGPHPHPQGGGSCLPALQPRPREDRRSLPSSGRRGHCGPVGTEGGEAGARGATTPPSGEEHAIPAAGLDRWRPRGPLFSVTTASGRAGRGHGPHHSPHGVAQVLIVVVEQLKGVDLGGSRRQAGGREGGASGRVSGPQATLPLTAHASVNCPQSLPMGRRRSGWGHPSLGVGGVGGRPAVSRAPVTGRQCFWPLGQTIQWRWGLTSVSGLRFLMMGFSRTDRWFW